MNKYVLLCAASAFAFPATAMAQSTGSVEFENDTSAIVVTGTRQAEVAGVQVPDTSKTRAVLDSEFIQHQTPGQSVNDVINYIPGVSFTNNDPYGSAGGTLTIRGFDATRISQTFDGVPLNDTGNYALYSNQQLDPELIEQVNVSLGSTDVDSPTAAATGSTVNYRTRLPFEDFSVRVLGSYGTYDFFRLFTSIDTGVFTPFGTRAFVSASTASNNAVFGHRGQIYKQQYNARIYQPLGDNGDFISVAGHYNQNRNNFFGSVPLRLDPSRVVGSLSSNRFPLTREERNYTTARCTINEIARTGIRDTANTCGTSFDERYNPSNTGNVRVASRFTLMDGLVLTVEPAYSYTKANGGGTATAVEGFRDINPTSAVLNRTGYLGGRPYFGRDLNGDGDLLDEVTVLAPSQTQTHRFTLISSLRWDINEDQSVRVAYSFDRGRHRQTGETGFLQSNGEPFDVFPVNDPLTAANGTVLQKRDRLSLAILHQVSGEYRGEFLDNRLTVNAGVRAPFFRRDLTNNCATSSASGFVECFGTDTAAAAEYAQLNPTIQGPQRRVLNYHAILPNSGLVFDLTPQLSVFSNYSRGLQVPGTDNLYNSFFFAFETDAAHPRPERSDNWDLGLRYRSGHLLAQVSGWYTSFQNRLASAYDPETDRTIYRNLGDVKKYGIDGSIAYEFSPNLQVYVFGSRLWSEIQQNVQIGGGESVDCSTVEVTNAQCAVTRGRREGGAPTYTIGGRVQGRLGPVELGVQAKRTGPRYVNDVNLPIMQGGVEVYGNRTPAYNIVDVDVRIPLEWAGLNDRTFFQLNVTNLFDVLYVGGFTSNLENTRVPNSNIGAPRAISGTLSVAF